MMDDPIDPRVTAALDWCEHAGGDRLTLAIPFELPTTAVQCLLERPLVTSLVVGVASDDPSLPSERIGVFLPEVFSWRLPTQIAPWVVYLGGRERITARMIRALLLQGVRELVFWDLDRWMSQSMPGIAAARVQAKIASVAEVMVSTLRARVPGAAAWFAGLTERRIERLLDPHGRGPSSLLSPTPNRVLIACPTLVAGGAERQIVNTVLGLQRQGGLDVRVLVSNLHAPPGNDFFLDILTAEGVDVQEVEGPLSTGASWQRYQSDPETRVPRDIRLLLKNLPSETADEVANLYVACRALRPAVVHAWLDHSNVCAGLAALMAGVPRVVLSGRNVSPIHFLYILKPIMRPAYRAMATRAEIRLVNNSHGGAADYAAWLGLDVGQFRIVYNGLQTAGLVRATPARIAAFRAQHGIPADAQLVGGMFRLSGEKRPGLWLETLMRLTAERPHLHGLLFGAGPLRGELEAKLARSGLAGRIHLAEPTKDSALALSAIDVLLLTSRWEGTPNVVIESQALSTPVVVCGGGGARESLAPGETGLFVEQPHAEALASAVRSLFDDPGRRSRYAAAGPAFVTERFGLERMLSQTLELYGFRPDPGPRA